MKNNNISLRTEMAHEYQTLKAYFLANSPSMSDSEFNYTLGQLNLLAGYTGNLKDYVTEILRPTAEKIEG